MTERPPTFNELLIQEVQRHPELYDQQHRVCTDSDERNCMWEAIAGRIDSSVSAGFAKKRWLQLRDRYRKELKTSLRSMTRPKWPYFEKLSWLDTYLKDSKSAGLNPLFLTKSFDSMAKSFDNLDTPSMNLDSFMKNDRTEIGEFNYSHTLNANTLLENIMAASSSAFEQLQRQRESGKFSPDSANAGNEDGDTSQNNGLLNSSESTSGGSEAGCSSGSDTETKLHQDSLSPERRSSAQSDTSCETDNQQTDGGQNCIREQNTPDHQSIFGNSTILSNTENFSFMGSLVRGLNVAAAQQKKSIRNPPYLVRRGGGIRVKPENNVVERPSLLSAFKPLGKTMSVGGLLNQLNTPSSANNRTNLHLTQSVGLERENNKSSFECQEFDEDMLFARLIVLRLKKLPTKEKRNVSSQIFDLLTTKEEEIEIG